MATTWYKALNFNPKKFPNSLKQITWHLNYIMNPKKTRNGELVTAVGCQKASAAIEFVMTQNAYEDATGRPMIYPDKNKKSPLCYSLRQAFAPGEVTAKQAHEIGLEFAKRFLGDKYQYVVATHVDREHIHNHIIYNSVNSELTKFHSTPYMFKQIRRINDSLCLENGLSIVENPKRSRKREITYHEKNPRVSFRNVLKEAIDLSIQNAKTYEEFLQRMKECEFAVRQGKYLAFRHQHNGQQRFIRAYTIGFAYSEKEIRNRIMNGSIPQNKMHVPKEKIKLEFSQAVALRARQFLYQTPANYSQAKANIQRYTDTIMTISRFGIKGYAGMDAKISDLQKQVTALEAKIEQSSQQIEQQKEIIQSLRTYQKFLSVAKDFDTLVFLDESAKTNFYDTHFNELELFQFAKEKLLKNNIDVQTDVTAFDRKIRELNSDQEAIQIDLKTIKQGIVQIETSKQVLDELKIKRTSKNYERGRNYGSR